MGQVGTQVGAKMHQKSMKVLVEFVVGFWKGSGAAKLILTTKNPAVLGPRGGVRGGVNPSPGKEGKGYWRIPGKK